MPPLLRELIIMINRLHVSKEYPHLWKRLRIAVTAAEMEEMKKWYREDKPDELFFRAVRGVPLHVESDPEDISYIVEH